jgi:uncharacterized protein (UPF0248 family)
MTPIHELLNRIRWDKAFGAGQFEIGYFDRQEGVVHRVAFSAVEFSESGEHTFQLEDVTGERRQVPFHRIREVYRDGACIWRRPAGGGSGGDGG